MDLIDAPMYRVVTLIRTDLKMNKGKIAAQASHAVQLLLLRDAVITDDTVTFRSSPALRIWLEGIYTKIVLGVSSEEELLELYHRALALDIPASLVVDEGLTFFDGTKTVTAAAFGPVTREVHDPITEHLKGLQ
jgi:peptidyl-tRNA hydrolase, PTH2 family